MSTRRMITCDMWEDDFIGGLSFFERILWIGLITLVDDQGRILDNSLVIQRRVFLYDENVKTQQVSDALQGFVKAGKVVSYEAAGKKLLQIVNWWKYQTPQWPQASKYPAPPRWIDRVKEHVTGSNTVRKVNWDVPGGFLADVPNGVPTGVGSDVPTGVPTVIDDGYGYGEMRVNDAEVEDGGAFSELPLSRVFSEETGILPFNEPRWIDAIRDMEKAGITEDDLRKAIGAMRDKKLKYSGPWSLVNSAAIELANRHNGNGRSAQRPGPSSTTNSQRALTPEERAEALARKGQS